MPKPTAGKKHDAKTEARLSVFWLVGGKLLIESAPLSECEQYGDHLKYPGSHIRVWERWQEFGKAPAETDYEEYARGRAMYSPSANTFTLLADRCILKRKELIAKIKEELRLPKRAIMDTMSDISPVEAIAFLVATRILPVRPSLG